ncbi:MAG TPA: DUF4910 domain-containing protein [Gemmatimonadales bacterium]|nr:DUF4910 domain-containing protein [Gemmatimonadales bacterium]
MKTSLAVLAAILLTAFGSPLPAQDFTPLLDAGRRDLLHEALSGERTKDHVIQISRHHRIQGSRGYRHAAEYVEAALRAAGFTDSDAFTESFPSDGRVSYQTWQSPSGWDITFGELRMVEPREERIVGYPEIAMSVITYSNPGDVTAELVWVGRGTSDADYEGKNVADKFVLATGYGGSVHRLAVLKYGAAAVVCYLDDDRAREYPDMLAYTGMWPLTEELQRVTFGFNLTNRQGSGLRALLERGTTVVLQGRVSGIGLEPYFMDVPVAVIRGSGRPDEEIVFSAHLDHPKESANDNASGSAALVDIAATLHQLIESGRLPRPKRTLRFLWVPEWYGTMAYIDRHPELRGPALGGRVLANLNLDMVGENLELIHSQMGLTRTPASIPSALSDVVANMAEMVSRMDVRTPRGSLSAMNYRVTPYSGGSDHMMFIDRKVPGIMLGHGPDYTDHTSEDTPDKVDPVELERSEIIAAATALYLSDLTGDEAADLAYLVGQNGMARLGAAAREVRLAMLTASDDERASAWFEGQNALTHTAAWEQAAVASVGLFNEGEESRRALRAAGNRLDQVAAALRTALGDEARAAGLPTGRAKTATDARVPVRLTRGPLDFGLPESGLDPARAAWYSTPEFTLNGNQRFELVNFIDGARTVTDIRNALSAEYGPVPTLLVGRYLEDLVEVGTVAWK